MAEEAVSCPLIPPFRFATVENGLFRGAYPTLKNFRFMRRLRLKTVVALIPEKPNRDYTEFCNAEGIEIMHLKVKKYNEEVSIVSEDIAKILSFIIDPRHHPCYVHCLDGTNITGLVIMCLRKLQHWIPSMILEDFSRFVLGEYTRAEWQFVEKFDGEIVLPKPILLNQEIRDRIDMSGDSPRFLINLPRWLWTLRHSSSHPTIRCIFPDLPRSFYSKDSPSDSWNGSEFKDEMPDQVFDMSPSTPKKELPWLRSGSHSEDPKHTSSKAVKPFGIDESREPGEFPSKLKSSSFSSPSSHSSQMSEKHIKQRAALKLKEEFDVSHGISWNYRREERLRYKYFDNLLTSGNVELGPCEPPSRGDSSTSQPDKRVRRSITSINKEDLNDIYPEKARKSVSNNSIEPFMGYHNESGGSLYIQALTLEYADKFRS